MTLSVGSIAPDFELKDQNGTPVKLSSFRGNKNVVVLFYPFSFTGICTGELCAIRDDFSSFQNENVEVLAISCDTMFTQRVFAEKENYQFSVLSDFWPHGEVAKAYGVFNEERGCAVRGTFVINKEGVIAWQVINGIGDARNTGDYLQALAAL